MRERMREREDERMRERERENEREREGEREWCKGDNQNNRGQDESSTALGRGIFPWIKFNALSWEERGKHRPDYSK